MGERRDRMRAAEKPEWMTQGRWWNSGWISVFGLVIFSIPILLVVVLNSDNPAIAFLFPGLLIYVSLFNIYRAWRRKRSGGRF